MRVSNLVRSFLRKNTTHLDRIDRVYQDIKTILVIFSTLLFNLVNPVKVLPVKDSNLDPLRSPRCFLLFRLMPQKKNESDQRYNRDAAKDAHQPH